MENDINNTNNSMNGNNGYGNNGYNNYNNNYNPNNYNSTEYGLYSFIAALAGFLFGLHIVGGILGLYFANEAEKHGEDSTMYKAGKIFAIIDLIFAGLVVLCIIAVIVMCLLGISLSSLSGGAYY